VTEADWDGCPEPGVMVEFLRTRGKLSERKARLFAVACCRRVWHLLSPPVRKGIEVAERFADGLATKSELSRAGRDCGVATGARAGRVAEAAARFATKRVSYAAYGRDPGDRAAWPRWDRLDDAECAAQCRLLRDLLGNPFRPVSADPAWLAWNGGAAIKLATAVYDDRELPSGHLDAARLAVLADMLEEAGCSDRQLLGHLRGPGPHIRGCWVVDLLLGKG
jgi:hypothetical protein